MTKLQVKVTDVHIGLGIRGDCYRCPLALALCDLDWHKALGLPTTILFCIDVSDEHFTLEIRSELYRDIEIELPRVACDFIRKFDTTKVASRNPKPFKFEIGFNPKSILFQP